MIYKFLEFIVLFWQLSSDNILKGIFLLLDKYIRKFMPEMTFLREIPCNVHWKSKMYKLNPSQTVSRNGGSMGGDSSNKCCLSTTMWNWKPSSKFETSCWFFPRKYCASCPDFFPSCPWNISSFPKNFHSPLIPDEISKFLEELCSSPDTGLVNGCHPLPTPLCSVSSCHARYNVMSLLPKTKAKD